MSPGIRAATLGLAAVCLPAFAQAQATGYISPSQAEANHAFQLNLSGSSGLNACLSLGNPKAVVTDTNIDLSVQTLLVPGAVCATGDQPFSFDFHLPAVKPGRYSVKAYILPACMSANPGCLPAPAPLVSTTLMLVTPDSLYYAIAPKQAQAGKAFDLSLLSNRFTCADEFLDTSVSVSGRTVILTYTDRHHPETICITPGSNHGPTFKLSALTDGTYQVFSAAIPYCAPGAVCPLARIAPQLAGYLDIGDPTRLAYTSSRSNLAGSQRLRRDGNGGWSGLWQGFRWDLVGRRPEIFPRISP